MTVAYIAIAENIKGDTMLILICFFRILDFLANGIRKSNVHRNLSRWLSHVSSDDKYFSRVNGKWRNILNLSKTDKKKGSDGFGDDNSCRTKIIPLSNKHYKWSV